jgi:hypothetical protein
MSGMPAFLRLQSRPRTLPRLRPTLRGDRVGLPLGLRVTPKGKQSQKLFDPCLASADEVMVGLGIAPIRGDLITTQRR